MNASARGLGPDVLREVVEVLRARVPLVDDELLVVAVSGGMDSMVLLGVLVRLRKTLRVRLHVAHLDHQLRSESREDRCFVEEQAAACGVPCTWAERDVRTLAADPGGGGASGALCLSG